MSAVTPGGTLAHAVDPDGAVVPVTVDPDGRLNITQRDLYLLMFNVMGELQKLNVHLSALSELDLPTTEE